MVDNKVDRFVCAALFSTLTNVDFDPERFVPLINEAVSLRKALAAKAGVSVEGGAADYEPADGVEALAAQGSLWGFGPDGGDADARSLKHLIIIGLRGVAAYADHAAHPGPGRRRTVRGHPRVPGRHPG